jgi:hypothetical protein
MVINLKEVPIGIAETESELNILKTYKLVKSILDISKKRKFNTKHLIIPPSVLNLIETHKLFHHMKITEEIYSPFLVGCLSDIQCFVDLYLPPNTIILSCDEQERRDLKIESIINNYSKEEYEIEIEVIY